MVGRTSNFEPVPETAIKHELSSRTGRWTRREATVALAPEAFQEGTMRFVYSLKDYSLPTGQQDCVAKLSKTPNEDPQTYFNEVEMQVQCRQMAEAFNRKNPPKRIDFLVPWVVEFPHRRTPNGSGKLLMLVEPVLQGRYVKHSNNYGFVAPEERNTPQAFSHFTWCASNGRLLVCDIQGVGDVYTDPQIHSNEGHGVFKYGKGDMGIDGIHKFFSTHHCNPICEFLGLTAQKKGCLTPAVDGGAMVKSSNGDGERWETIRLHRSLSQGRPSGGTPAVDRRMSLDEAVGARARSRSPSLALGSRWQEPLRWVESAVPSAPRTPRM